MSIKEKAVCEVEVAPAVPLSGKRQTYTYHMPFDMVPENKDDLKNMVVSVSFGPRKTDGVILGISGGVSRFPTKPVAKLTMIKLTDNQIQWARMLADVMRGGLGFTLRLFMPATLNRKSASSVASSPARATLKKKSGILKEIKDGTYSYLEKNSDKRYEFLKKLALISAGENKEVLIVMPEVWMVEKMEELFAGKNEGVAFFHAGLKAGNQNEIWQALYEKKISVVVGTQKALFLPWHNLDTIVVVEEQFSSHKLFDQYPRLHNVTGVKQLQVIHKSALVYSSSFPSLSLFYGMQTGDVKKLHNNISDIKPEIFTSTFEDRKNKHLLPHEFTEKMRMWLRKKDKVLVLYNQRGSWSQAYCKDCARAVSCAQCRTALSIHGTGKAKVMVCHQCANTVDLPEKCPLCHKGSLKYIGVGSEIVEHVLSQLAPWYKDLIRIDADTLKTMTDKKIQRDIEARHIVMGTSALFRHVKGRQFDRVVWLFPERGLQYPDFRSYERNYLLLARLQSHVAGKRKVTVVTRNPQLAEAVFMEKTSVFYEYQLKERQRLKYPPFRELARLTVTGKTQGTAMSKAKKVREALSKRIGPEKKIIVRGPFQGFQRYRKQKAEAHIVMLGASLFDMAEVYADLPVDMVDINPQRIV